MVVGGCTKPPPLPSLRAHDRLPPESVVLRDTLSPSDIREIFAAINRDGKLDSLKPYFESVSDGEMSAMADVLSRFFYEDAYRADSFAALLGDESARKGFSDWAAAARRWEGRPAFQQETAALRDLISLDSFPKIARADAGLLDPDWLAVTIATWQEAGAYRERAKWPAPEAITAASTVDDITRFLGLATDKQIKDLVSTFLASEFGTTLLKAAAAHGKQYGTAGFEGFARGLSKLIATGAPKNQLEVLVNFARALDGNSDGMFRQMEDKLQDRELARQLSTYLRAPLVRGVAGVMREAFVRLEGQGRQHGAAFWLGTSTKDGKPSRAFIDLFFDLRESLDVATKPSVRMDGEDEGDGYIARAPIYLHAYALAKWLEHIVGENRDAFQKPDSGWTMPVESKGWELKLADERDDKAVLKASAQAELTAIGLGDFASTLAAAAPGEKPRRFIYTFPAIDKKPLREAFRDAVAACDDARAIANLSPALVSLAYSLTSAEARASFRIRDLETDQLLDSINGLVPKNYATWTKLESLLFDDVGIADLPQGARDLFLGFFEGAQLKRVTQILDSLGTFREADRPAAPGLPSAFAFYLRAISFSRPEEIHSPAALLSFLSDTKLFTPSYPAVFKFVKNANQLGKAGYALSLVPARQRESVLTPLAEVFNATDEHLQVLRYALPKHSRALSSMFDAWSEARFTPPTDKLTRAELRWLVRLVKDGGLEVIWSYLKNHGSRENLLGAVNELKALSAKGYLADVFYLLGHINDERMKRVAASLSAWDANGELVATLDFVQTLLSDRTKNAE